MKTTLSPQDQLALTLLNWVGAKTLNLMQTHPESNETQLKLQETLGQMRADIIQCGCKRPSSCGSCRSAVEDEVYWSEKIDDILDEAIDEDRAEQRRIFPNNEE